MAAATRVTEPSSADSRQSQRQSHVQHLDCREREARDRGWWNEMRATWHEDSQVNVSWYSGTGRGFVDGSMGMRQRSGPVKHKLGPVMVRVNGDKAVASVSATISTRLTVEGVEGDLSSDTRLLYRAVKEDGGGLLTGLDCIYESDRIEATIPGETVYTDAEVFSKYRKSYRYLSFVLEKGGTSVNKDLPGDDRPDQVEHLYSDAFEWRGLSVS